MHLIVTSEFLLLLSLLLPLFTALHAVCGCCCYRPLIIDFSKTPFMDTVTTHCAELMLTLAPLLLVDCSIFE